MRGVMNMTNQLRAAKSTRFAKFLLCSLFALLWLNGLAWGANGDNKLMAVSLDAGAATPTILIETAEPVGYKYTVYDSFEPIRVVIDFPGMELSDIEEQLALAQGAIQGVRVAGFDLASGQLARVEILLAEATEYQVSLDGQQFRVAFEAGTAVAPVVSEPAAPPVAAATEPVGEVPTASELLAVKLTPGQAIVEANGKIDNFKSFTLENPGRLVIDLFGLQPVFKEREFPAEAGMAKVRLGTYRDKTRLVFDASGSALPTHQVEARATDLLVSWGEPVPADQVPAVAETPAASPATETETPAADPPAQATGPAAVEAIDFSNEDGRSTVNVTLSGPAKVTGPIEEGNLVRFEIVHSSISRALRRKIDASAFPSAVTSVTPYTVSDGDHQNVRIAVALKGQAAYALEQDGRSVRLVIDDGAFAEPAPPAVSTVEVVAPERPVTSTPAGRTEEKMVLAPTTETVTAAEMTAEAERYTGEKITLVFDAANVRSILQLIGDVSGFNILASSDVQGTVTLRLIDVPWDQALDLVLETANLGKIQQGNILRIMPKGKIREIEQEAMKEQMVAIEEGVLETRTYSISYASVDDMKAFLTDIKSDRGSIIADSRNKQLIVRDAVAVLEQMEEMILQIDKPERQVMIEARIVEANTNFSRNLGVKWNFDYSQSGVDGDESFSVNDAALGLGGSFILPVTNPALAGAASAISFGALDSQLDIDLRLAALENSGEGRIVSTPKITTLNGEQATISQGTKIPFSSVSDQGTDVQFENAELKLSVTPEINPDGSILLEIDASNSSVGTVVPTATGDAVSIDEKKAQTKVLVRNGQTTVIGGIFIEQENESQSGVPLLKDVPVLGHLFKSTTKSKDRRELLIFITPRIVES